MAAVAVPAARAAAAAMFTQNPAPPAGGNWGGRDVTAAGPDGATHLTWDYARTRPQRSR